MNSFYKVYTKGRYEEVKPKWLLTAEFRELEDAQGWICLEKSMTETYEYRDNIEFKIMHKGCNVEKL